MGRSVGLRGLIRRATVGVAASVVIMQVVGAPPAAAESRLPPDVPLSGRLIVRAVEPGPRPAGNVTLVTTDGTRVRLTGDAVAGAVSGDRFQGTVAVSSSLRDSIARRSGGRLPTDAGALGELVADASADADAALRVTAATLTPASVSPTAAKSHTVDVMYLRPSGSPAPSPAAVDAVLGRLKEFWVSQSNGQIANVTRPAAVKFTTQPRSVTCDSDAAWEYAAGSSGFKRKGVPGGPPDSYYWAGDHAAHLIVIVPSNVCSDGGQGTIGTMHSGGLTWSSVDAADLEIWDGVLFHEFGHNLGLMHSNVLHCNAPPVVDAPTPTCEPYEYQDYYDVMGGSISYYMSGPGGTQVYTNDRNVAALNVTQKVRLGALPSGTGLRAVRLADGKEQTLTLRAAGAASGVRGLEVLDPLNGDKLYVEYRSGTGRDAGSFYKVFTGENTWAPGVRVLKLGCTPSSACKDDRARESVVLGRWTTEGEAVLWYGPGDNLASRSRGAGRPGVRITVVSTNAESAVVRVSFEAPSPVPSATPTIAGKARIGITLTAKPGAWAAGTSFGYQWRVAGKAVAGATASTFVPRSADKGKTVTVQVTGSHPDFVSVTKTSSPTAKVLPLLKLKSAKPKISGKARVGVTLKAKPGKWTAGTAFSYQWRVSGKSVSGATAATFVPRAGDKGKKITVRVTGTKAGYKTVAKTSKSTAAVKK